MVRFSLFWLREMLVSQSFRKRFPSRFARKSVCTTCEPCGKCEHLSVPETHLTYNKRTKRIARSSKKLTSVFGATFLRFRDAIMYIHMKISTCFCVYICVLQLCLCTCVFESHGHGVVDILSSSRAVLVVANVVKV